MARIETELATRDDRTRWFTGDSLDGAMALICAGRCFLSHIPAMPEQVYTDGAPLRWVNNNDVVARVPPTWMGYRHVGSRMYLNAHRRLRKLTKRQRARARWRGSIEGAKQGKVDHFADHAVAGCVRHIGDAVEAQEAVQRRYQAQ